MAFSIDKSSVHNIKFYQYRSTNTVTASKSLVDQWIPEALRIFKEKHDGDELLAGLNTEWCLPSEPGENQKVAIVRLSVGEICLIFQLHHADHVPQSLVDFLGNDNFKFVFSVHNIKFYKYRSTAVVTASGSVVDQWIPEALRIYKEQHDGDELLVGLDTEWCLPSEPGAEQKVAIVQISVGESCLIFQLHHADYIPQSLLDFLCNDKITFVGKEVKLDAKKLKKDFGLRVAKRRDVSHWAARSMKDEDYKMMGLKRLVREFFCMELEKPKEITLSDWTVKELTFRQIEYACLDAYLSFKIAHYLSKRRPPEEIYAEEALRFFKTLLISLLLVVNSIAILKKLSSSREQ